MGYKLFTSKEDDFINEHYLTISIGNIAKHLERSRYGIRNAMKRLGLIIPIDILEARKSMCWKKKGDVPFNKGKKQVEYMSPEVIAIASTTRFKKGNIPHNTTYDGHERISKDGYIIIRVRLGMYVLKHKHVWESINGKIPPKHCIRFKDGNKMNTSLDNLELVTRAENIKINQEGFRSLPLEIQEAQGLINKINRKIKKHGNKKQVGGLK